MRSLVALSQVFNEGSGGVDDFFPIFDCLSPFCFLLIEFHCTFPISHKILQSYVYYYHILTML